MALIVRSGTGREPTLPPPPPSAESLDIQTVPVPQLPGVSQEVAQDRLERDLTRQQDLVGSLQDELKAQQDLADDLKTQLERQQAETDQVLEQLDTYQEAVESMTSQQVRLIESIPRNNENQTMILWGILGLFLILMLAGARLLPFLPCGSCTYSDGLINHRRSCTPCAYHLIPISTTKDLLYRRRGSNNPLCSTTSNPTKNS
jgi:hypothetical protein